MRTRSFFVASVFPLLVACGSPANQGAAASSGTSTTAGAGGGGGSGGSTSSNPCAPDSCSGPSTSGAGGTSDTESIGAGGSMLVGLVANAADIPDTQDPSTHGDMPDVLEVFFGPGDYSCSNSAFASIECVDGFAVALPANWGVGDYELNSLGDSPAQNEAYVHTADPGCTGFDSGVFSSIYFGTLTITSVGGGMVAGHVTDVSGYEGLLAHGFSFVVNDCVANP